MLWILVVDFSKPDSLLCEMGNLKNKKDLSGEKVSTVIWLTGSQVLIWIAARKNENFTILPNHSRVL